MHAITRVPAPVFAALPPAAVKGAAAAPSVAGAAPEVEISSLAGRLARASQAPAAGEAGLDRQAYAAKVQGAIDTILYRLDDEHKARAALEVPQPNDAASAASARAATAFVDDSSQPNPFAGLSREQLATVYMDESGAFTINERRAAYMQAYNEEQAWRMKVVEAARRELAETGEMAGTSRAAREHVRQLPLAERVLYRPA